MPLNYIIISKKNIKAQNVSKSITIPNLNHKFMLDSYPQSP